MNDLIILCCIYKIAQHKLYVVLYVDDVLIIGKSAISWIKNKLSHEFQMKDLKEISHFLGLNIRRDIENQITEISQVGYTKNILKRFGMENCKPIATPMDVNNKCESKEDRPTGCS